MSTKIQQPVRIHLSAAVSFAYIKFSIDVCVELYEGQSDKEKADYVEMLGKHLSQHNNATYKSFEYIKE